MTQRPAIIELAALTRMCQSGGLRRLTITHILSQSFAPVAISVNRDNPRHMIRFPGGGSLARAR